MHRGTAQGYSHLRNSQDGFYPHRSKCLSQAAVLTDKQQENAFTDNIHKEGRMDSLDSLEAIGMGFLTGDK